MVWSDRRHGNSLSRNTLLQKKKELSLPLCRWRRSCVATTSDSVAATRWAACCSPTTTDGAPEVD